MPGTPRIRAIRTGYDVDTGEPFDMAFDSTYNIQKVVKATRKTSAGVMTHGLFYPPEMLFMTEVISSPKRFANIGSSSFTIDESGATVVLSEHLDPIDPDPAVPLSSSDDVAIWGYTLLDQLETPSVVIPQDRDGHPTIRVGELGSPYHYLRKIDSYYDTFKVLKTGSLSISKEETTYHDGDAGLVETTTVTYDHDLGYVPMFAPFVDYETILNFNYDWLAQWQQRGFWATATSYGVSEIVSHPVDGDTYRCIKAHTSGATSKPADGASWETYWELLSDLPAIWATATSYVVDDYVIVDSIYGDYFSIHKCIANHTSSSTNHPETGVDRATYWEDVTATYFGFDVTAKLNDLEDVKFVYGGVSAFNVYIARFYVTTTQIVLELVRATYNFEDPSIGLPNAPVVAIDLSVDFTIFVNRADEEFDLL